MLGVEKKKKKLKKSLLPFTLRSRKVTLELQPGISTSSINGILTDSARPKYHL